MKRRIVCENSRQWKTEEEGSWQGSYASLSTTIAAIEEIILMRKSRSFAWGATRKRRVCRRPVDRISLSCDHRSNTIASMQDRTVMFEVDVNAVAQQNSGRGRGEVISRLQQRV